MAMLRYLVMAYWEEKKPQEQTAKRHPDAHPGFEYRDGCVTIKDERRYPEREQDYQIPQYKVIWPSD